MEAVVLVHGGAGDIPDSRREPKLIGVRKAANVGWETLISGGNVLDAAEAAVKSMELDEAFNAGYGSVLNLAGEVEMDASIMLGRDLNAGAVTVVKNIQHPVSLARQVMEKTPHVMLAAGGAEKFARDLGTPILPPGRLVSPYARKALEDFVKFGHNPTEIGPKSADGDGGEVGTVGCVVIDSEGNMAAATSTGGINGKMVGRSSDTSLIGSGTYADDLVGAVSTTGHGETIAKYCLAHAIINEMKLGAGANLATTKTLAEMTDRLKNTAGAITISKSGEVGIGFTSNRMAWAYRTKNKLHYGLEQGEHLTVDQ